MGRAPGYDADEVIETARDLFWTRGFDDVSVSDVEKATGLSRSSIYHAFGSMRGLFDAVVQNYLDAVVRPRLRGLQAEIVADDALAAYLHGLADAIARRADAVGDVTGAPTGCLLVATAVTSLGADGAVREVIAAYHHELLQAVTAGLRATGGQAAADLEQRARVVAGAVISANVLARVNAAEAVRLLRATADTVAVSV
ncbi:TetR family transcriptional regulator [Gordonia sp. HNM0687]|uniref:TetR family transcriptional regulator n=1 Tax=Gordonia mangrovi TaxID=2665643 RepID=A0A6L7GS52_9ACTN|nr:TetR/AcrR family transcriptional regulator [Gordonia mangrovi]MXP22403.1 TetR family transcriptional regulator [Gordonia mangrovi]UVF77714.1 TetR/AcrR family transcriptional regulator [Gordonia mangrovi]